MPCSRRTCPVPTTKSDPWWKHLGNWVQLAIGVITLGGMLWAGIIWASDQRYVLKGELAEAVSQIGVAINKSNSESRAEYLEGQIEDLQDDIVFFSEEDGMESSVKRRCRKLPRVIQDWEAETSKEWESDPIVEAACRTATLARVEE